MVDLEQSPSPNITPKSAHHAHAHARRIALTFGFMAACGPFAIDTSLPAFPTIARDLGTSTATVQITLAIYLFGLAAGQFVWGTLCDRIGRRIPLLAGMILFTSMAVVCAMTRSIETMIVARFFQGLGGSAGIVVSRAIVRDMFEHDEAARFFTLIMIVGGIAPIIAPFMGALLLTHFGWRSIFWVLFVYGWGCIAALARYIPETLAPENYASGHVLDVLRGYGRILVDRRFIGPALAIGCMTGILFTYVSNSSYIFLELFKVPVSSFGFLFAANSIGLYVGGQSNRWLLRRFRSVQLMQAGLWINLAMAGLLTVCAASGLGGFPALFVVLFACLSTLGIIFPNATALVMQPFAAEAGFASALLGIVQFLIGSAGGALVGQINNGTALPMAIQILALGVIAKAMLMWSKH